MMRIPVAAATAATLVWLLLPAAEAADSPAAPPPQTSADTYRELDLFGEVFERVRSEYVETVTDEQLVEAAINGMLSALDPHSSYMNAKSFRDMQVQVRGEFGGLGIEVTMENGLVKVVSPIDDTPAAHAGLKPGDFIVEIDGEPVLGMTLNDAVEKMRGPVGSEIKLTIRREGRDPFDVTVKRAVVKIQSVKSQLEGDDIGYIRITSFNEQADSGVKNAIKQLQGQGGRQAGRHRARSPQQSGRPPRPGRRRLQRFPRPGRDRLDPRPPPRGRAALQRPGARRSHQGTADGRADQWRLGLGLRDRRRRAPGPASRRSSGHALLRQGLGADHHPAARATAPCA